MIVAAITSRITKPRMVTHVALEAKKTGLERDSVVLLEQIRTIDKQRLEDRVTHLDSQVMHDVDGALKVSVGLVRLHTGKSREH